MNHYKKIQDATLWLEGKFIENKGSTLPLVNIRIKFRRVYGFGSKLLNEMLKDYEQLGTIKITNDIIEISGDIK